MSQAADTGCCPPFDPTPWRDTERVWKDERFVKDHVTSLFHVPLNMGRKITKDLALIEAAHARPAQQIMLSDERSPWGSDLYIAVAGDVPGATTTTLPGRYLTRVYDGPFKDAGRWMDDTRRWAEARGEQVESLYLGYTTCPACAKAYGHNYVVVFARVAGERAPATA